MLQTALLQGPRGSNNKSLQQLSRGFGGSSIAAQAAAGSKPDVQQAGESVCESVCERVCQTYAAIPAVKLMHITCVVADVDSMLLLAVLLRAVSQHLHNLPENCAVTCALPQPASLVLTFDISHV